MDKGRKEQVTTADAMSCVCRTVTRKERREKNFTTSWTERTAGANVCVAAPEDAANNFFRSPGCHAPLRPGPPRQAPPSPARGIFDTSRA